MVYKQFVTNLNNCKYLYIEKEMFASQQCNDIDDTDDTDERMWLVKPP